MEKIGKEDLEIEIKKIKPVGKAENFDKAETYSVKVHEKNFDMHKGFSFRKTQHLHETDSDGKPLFVDKIKKILAKKINENRNIKTNDLKKFEGKKF